MLIVFAGLPGTGKSTIARALAVELAAVWLRIDTLEQAIRTSGVVDGDVKDLGYRAAHAVAEDNLRLGRTVIGDSVNPWMLTRNAWRDAGLRAGVRVVEIARENAPSAQAQRFKEGSFLDADRGRIASPGMLLENFRR